MNKMISQKEWYKRLMYGIRKALRAGKYKNRPKREESVLSWSRRQCARSALSENPNMTLESLRELLGCSIGTAWNLKKKILGEKK